MTSVVFYARSDLRRRLRSWLAVAFVAAVAGGAVLTLAAGARRAASAYPRFLRAARAPDVRMFAPAREGRVDEILAQPEVAEATRSTGLSLVDPDMGAIALDDPKLGTSLSRFKMLHGRRPRDDRPDEAMVSFVAAQAHHLKVGSRLTLHFLVNGPNGPDVQAVDFRVVGIEATPGEFPPQALLYSKTAVYVSAAFLHSPVGEAATGDERFVSAAVRLKGGPSQAQAFVTNALRLSDGLAPSQALADDTAGVERSMRQQASALWLTAGCVALAGALILSQLLVRQVWDGAPDASVLRALGMTPQELALGALLEVAAAAALGAALAVSLAAAASPLLPLGTARIAEPHPGLAFDATVLGLGAAGLMVVLVAMGVAAVALGGPFDRRSSQARDLEDVGASRAARLPMPVPVTTGVRMAVQSGRGRSAVPARSTLTAAAVGLAAVAAALTFGASLGRLLDTPNLYGLGFDADVQSQGPVPDVRPLVASVRADPTVEAAAFGWTGIAMQSHGVHFGAQATTPVRGTLDATLLEGRLPRAVDEIVLGPETAREVRAHIGQRIPVTIGDSTGPLDFRVVGLGVMPPFDATDQLGRGAVITTDGLDAFIAEAPPDFVPPPPSDLLVRFRSDVNPERGMAHLLDELGGPGRVSVVAARQPADVANFGQVNRLPTLLAGLLAVIAAAATAHLLVSSVRRRGRDLAVLKTLGFTPSQVSAVVATQATTVALIALAVGLPLGAAAGRWLWTVVAGQVGVVPAPALPWTLVTVVPAASLIVANLVAAGPARTASQIPAAAALRTE